jgi:fructose/tagatose bisphosphate aldolase
VRRPKPVFDLVVFDGSALLFGENVTKTKQAVTGMKATHPSIVVAGELGFIGSSSSIHIPIPIGHGRRRPILRARRSADIENQGE